MRTSAGARQTEHGAGRAALKLLLIFVAACLALFGLLAAAAELFVPGLVALTLAALAALGAVRLGARKAARKG